MFFSQIFVYLRFALTDEGAVTKRNTQISFFGRAFLRC